MRHQCFLSRFLLLVKFPNNNILKITPWLILCYMIAQPVDSSSLLGPLLVR